MPVNDKASALKCIYSIKGLFGNIDGIVQLPGCVVFHRNSHLVRLEKIAQLYLYCYVEYMSHSLDMRPYI